MSRGGADRVFQCAVLGPFRHEVGGLRESVVAKDTGDDEFVQLLGVSLPEGVGPEHKVGFALCIGWHLNDPDRYAAGTIDRRKDWIAIGHRFAVPELRFKPRHFPASLLTKPLYSGGPRFRPKPLRLGVLFAVFKKIFQKIHFVYVLDRGLQHCP